MSEASSESQPYSGRYVNPGNIGAFRFTVPPEVGPGEDDASCLTYMYYSGVDMARDVNAGLIGPLLICREGALDPYTDRQVYILYFSLFKGLDVCVEICLVCVIFVFEILLYTFKH